MANEMGSEDLEPFTNEPEENFYTIVKYDSNNLPKDLKNLVLAPFLNTLRYGNDLFKLIDKNAYYDNYARYIHILLARPNSKITIATLSDDTAIGWCLWENKTVHYVWVKSEVRRQGIANAILPKDFDTISHITNKGINIWVSKFPNVRFNPFA